MVWNKRQLDRWATLSDIVTLSYLGSMFVLPLAMLLLLDGFTTISDKGNRAIVIGISPFMATLRCLLLEATLGPRRTCRRNMEIAKSSAEMLGIADKDKVVKLASIIKSDLQGKYVSISRYP